MQEFFKNIQGKIWLLLQRLFGLTASAMKIAWPLLGRVFVFYLAIYTLTRNYLQNFTEIENKNYTMEKQVLRDSFHKNPRLGTAIGIAIMAMLLFWFWMLRCAKRNETSWKKSWIFFIFILGPFGALFYYFFKERPLEKRTDQHDKLMMSFFTPMHKNSTKT